MEKAKISEIFLSVQGEGLHFGLPQLFIRFYDCNLSCDFCDTNPASFKTFTIIKLMERISRYKNPYHSLSLTGGEPLLQADFLKSFLPEYKKSYGKPVYLETNGTLPEELSKIIDYADIIAMDFKLPSSIGRRGVLQYAPTQRYARTQHAPSFWAEHERFLKIARIKKVFIKAVITQNTSPAEIVALSDMVAGIRNNIPVVLQPVTALEKKKEVGFENLRRFKNLLQKSIKRVDIIPQVHKLIGVR